MPKNAYLFAKVGADTAENEQNIAEFLTKFLSDFFTEVLSSGQAERWPRRRPATRRRRPRAGSPHGSELRT